MIIKNASYEVTAVKPEQYPEGDIPEIAFVGRSNVGKSSIINTLVNRKNLARVGSTPGKTRQINFFNVDNVLRLVDLPGYGYANVSKEEKASWGKLADAYLSTRSQLKLIIMLVDIRHTPTKDDKVMHQWLKDTNIPYIVVTTKSDKISRAQISKRIGEIRKELELTDNISIIPFTSLKKQGKDELLEEIASILEI